MYQTALVVAAMLGLLGLAGLFSWYVWSELEGVEISLHGYIALGLGVVLTFALGAGLMALVFFSDRRGFDDDAGHD